MSHDNNYYVETAFEYNLSFPERTLFLNGEIEEESTRKFLIGLHLLDRKEGPITVVLNSNGGSVDDGFAIYGAIRQTSNPVTIKVLGQASSMAAIILQAANTRVADRDSFIMLHLPSYDLSDTHSCNLERQADESKKLRDKFYDILEKRTGNTKAEWRRWLTYDKYYTATEAKQFNLVDEVI
jgi:ATP-dependent Clp protease, protease subunit